VEAIFDAPQKPHAMKIVIPDDYQDIIDRLECFALLRGHEVVRYREPARHEDELAARLADADVKGQAR
jgi:D-3-phosphoglycerate dehydrogenase